MSTDDSRKDPDMMYPDTFAAHLSQGNLTQSGRDFTESESIV